MSTNYFRVLKKIFPDITTDQFRLLENEEGLQFVVWNRAEPMPDINLLAQYAEEGAQVSAKEIEIETLKANLAKTDWYNNRFLDTGTPMPDEIKMQRTAWRAQINALEVEINALLNIQ